MNRPQFSRREWLGATIAASALAAMGPTRPVRAQARATAAEPITPALVEAAKKEGKLAFYSAMDLSIAEKFAKAFEARFPGITVRVERSGAERVFQRAGAGEPHLCGRCGQQRGRRAFHRLEAQRLARAISAGGGRAALSRAILRPRRIVGNHSGMALLARPHHESGETGRGARHARRA